MIIHWAPIPLILGDLKGQTFVTQSMGYISETEQDIDTIILIGSHVVLSFIEKFSAQLKRPGYSRLKHTKLKLLISKT